MANYCNICSKTIQLVTPAKYGEPPCDMCMRHVHVTCNYQSPCSYLECLVLLSERLSKLLDETSQLPARRDTRRASLPRHLACSFFTAESPTCANPSPIKSASLFAHLSVARGRGWARVGEGGRGWARVGEGAEGVCAIVPSHSRYSLAFSCLRKKQARSMPRTLGQPSGGARSGRLS